MRIKVMISLMLLSAGAMAQGIRPTFKEGLVKKTHTDIDLTIKVTAKDTSMTMNAKMSYEAQYTVKSLHKDSALIEFVMTKVNMPEDKAIAEGMGAVKDCINMPIVFSFNLDGTPRHLINRDELKKHYRHMMEAETDSISDMVDIDQMLNNIVTDESQKANLNKSDMFEIYGVPLKDGYEDTQKVQMMKFKRKFTVSPDMKVVNIVYSSAAAENDVMDIIKKSMQAVGSDRLAEMTDVIAPAMKQLGMDKMGIYGVETQTLSDDGWPSTIKSYAATIMGTMGMGMSMNTVVK